MARIQGIFTLLALVGLTLVLSATARAADPTGTWSWKFERPERTIEVNLDLKLEGDKLTGKVYGNDRETEISDGKFENDEVSFKTVRERNGNKFVISYKGKVEGDKITGTVEFETPDRKRELPWEATRVKKK
jgi:hypothetical protein